MPPSGRLAAVLLAAALVASGCGGPPPAPRLDAGAAAYRAGEPAFVLEAVPRIHDDGAGVDVHLGLPPASLVFRRWGDSLRAVASWTITVEREGGAPRTRTPVDTFRAARAEARSPALRWRSERFDLPPGAYVVRAVLEDLTSDRTAERRAHVVVPAPSSAPSLLGLRLEEKGPGGRVEPVDPGAVPAGLDSLRASVQVLGAPGDSWVELAVRRLRADTTVAWALVESSPREGTLVTRGVDPDVADTVQVARQPVAGRDVSVPFVRLGPGVYRAEVRLRGPDGDAQDATSRQFVVRRRDYPQLARFGDLIGPLEYLADARTVASIRDAPTATARRRAFDRFWGASLDDRRVAAATLRAYYERVEEANRLFATYKDGWKTDRGMAYILLGPPRFVEQRMHGERWTYGGGGAAPLVLDFVRTAGPSFDGRPFEVLTLQRGRHFDDAWRAVRRQWRSGVVP